MEDFSFDKIKFMIDGLKKTKIYPFSWRNGVVNLTEKGYVESSASSSNYSFMQKYFTGKDVLTIVWDESTKLTVWDAQKGQMKYNFKVGLFYEAIELPPASNTLDIGKNDAHEDFINMTGSYEVSFAVYNIFPTEDDLYKPYIILSETGRKVLFLTNYLITRNPNNYNECITTLTFISSKDKLMTSGRAIEQFIQFAAPGEPYAFPEEQPDGKVKLSQQIGQSPELVKYIQIEHQGAAAYCGTLITGRKIWKDPQTGFWISSPPLFLLPRKFVNTQTNPLNKTGATTKSYYFFNDETVETRTNQDFQNANKNLDSALAPLKNEGVFTMGKQSEWNQQGHEGIHRSNFITDGQYTDFMDLDWHPNWETINRNSLGCLYTSDNNQITANDTMIQILIKNAFLYSTQLELPLDFTDSKPYRWSTIPIIGPLIQRFYGDKAMFSSTKSKKTVSLAYFINTSVAQSSTKYFSQPSDGTARWYGTLSTWLGDGAPKGLCVQGLSTCFAFELTDKISFHDSYDNTDRVLSTANLGQEKDENGVFFHEDETPLHLDVSADGNIQPIKTTEGYVIDQIQNFALFNGKIKISCFGKYSNSNMTNPLFTQTVLSSSKFESENVRNWCTEINCGSWPGQYVEGNIEWPNPPAKDTTEHEIIINKKGRNFNFHQKALEAAPTLYYFSPDQPTAIFDYYDIIKQSESEYSGYLTISDDIWNKEMDYSEILQEGKGREWILNNIDHFAIDVSGSRLNNYVHDVFYQNNYNADIKQGSISMPIDEFVYDEEKDEYLFEKKFGIGALNCGLDNPILNVGWDQVYSRFWSVHVGQTSSHTTYFNSGFSQIINVKIILKSDSVRFELKDQTTIYGYYFDQDKEHATYIQFGHEPATDFDLRGSQITSQISVNSLYLIEK